MTVFSTPALCSCASASLAWGFTTSEMTMWPAYCPSTAMWMIVPTLWQSWYGMFSWVISLLLPAATVCPSTQAVTPWPLIS